MTSQEDVKHIEDCSVSKFDDVIHFDSMFDDKVSLLHYALQKRLQAAPNRLMTGNVYTALLSASLKTSARDEEMNFCDPQHRFEHLELLLVLLRSLPYSTKSF